MIPYLTHKYVIELKVWDGQTKHQKGVQQLADYLEAQNLGKGYLVIFDFRKTTQNEWKQDRMHESGKDIFAVWV